MDKIFINDNARTRYFNMCMIQASYPQIKVEGVPVTRSEKPAHDSTCLSGDTKIRTLDGYHEIKGLVGKEFYVWSYSHKERRMVPTKAGKCWKSGVNQKLLEVKLDSGEIIKCTPTHRFMTRTGDYIEARDIQRGQSLMPFYERNDSGYNRVELNDGTFAIEHQCVFSRFNGYTENGFHIHHVDDNKTNNNPENLKKLSQSEHILETKPHLGRSSKSFKKRNITTKNKARIANCPVCEVEFMCSYKQIYCSQLCQRNNERLALKIKKIQEGGIEKICAWCGDGYVGFQRTKTCSIDCTRKRTANYNKIHRSNLSKGIKIKMVDVDNFKNHKIISIKELDVTEDVYDIEVPELHNFVANGVVLHNSHYRSSLEYGALGLESIEDRTDMKPRDKFKPKERTLRQWGGNRRVVGY